MKALLVVRPDAATRPGGDLVHAEHARDALRAQGVEAELVATETPQARGFDVAHVFGVFQPETAARQIDAVRAANVPLALSPIWLDLRALFATAPQIERALAQRSAAAVERRLARVRVAQQRSPWQGGIARNADRRAALQRALMLRADVLLPASEVEAYLYGERLQVTQIPFVVAPLGIDPATFAVERWQPRRGVLCAARVEPKKNQALLLYALRELDVEVTIVGQAHDAPYLALCRRWATPRTRFLDHADGAEVLAMMARCAVHAHPSWLESPGLSSLEAAAAGARIVTGDRGCEREYFGPEIDYADPADADAIRDAVVRALARAGRERDDALERRLATRTWQRHAEATIDAYTRAIAAHRASP